MENFIIGGIIVLILGGAIGYIINAKRKGVKCIGCPSGGNCSKGGCSCHCKEED